MRTWLLSARGRECHLICTGKCKAKRQGGTTSRENLSVNDKAETKPIVIIGGGGHASVLVDILKQQGRKIVAVISPDDTQNRHVYNDIEIIKKDSDISRFPTSDILLVNGIGILPGSSLRFKMTDYYSNLGFKFETVVASTAIISPFAILGAGSQVLHGAIIQAGANIGSHCVINTRAVIEHDVHLGSHNFISPGAIICGQCKSEEGVFVGAGATVIQNIELGAGCSVMANALVSRNVLPRQKVYTSQAIVR
nr:acetyltransferase [Lelliottia amnigena]